MITETRLSAEAAHMLYDHAREMIDVINLRIVRDTDLCILTPVRQAKLELARKYWQEIVEATA